MSPAMPKADPVTDDALAAAIVGVIGDKSPAGLSPQGEANVRLALHVGRLKKQLAERDEGAAIVADLQRQSEFYEKNDRNVPAGPPDEWGVDF